MWQEWTKDRDEANYNLHGAMRCDAMRCFASEIESTSLRLDFDAADFPCSISPLGSHPEL